MKKIKRIRKVGAYFVIMLIWAVIISSSIGALDLNKNFSLKENLTEPFEKQSVENPLSLAYSSAGPGLIWLKGKGYFDLSSGYYNITFTGFLAGFIFIPLFSGGPAIAWHTSPTYEFTAGYVNTSGFTFLTFTSSGSPPLYNVWIIGLVNHFFTIDGVSYW